jgi:hypothetical protein
VVKGEDVKGACIVLSRLKLLRWSWAEEVGAGEVKFHIFKVLSSLAVAKYLFAGSKQMPLT